MTEPGFHLMTHVLCPYVQRSVIVLEEKGIAYQRTDIDLANKPEWFKQISPLGKVPVLVVGGDHTLFESAVICEYLDEITPGTLHPQDPLEKASHRAWIEFGSGLLNAIGRLYNADSPKSFEQCRLDLRRQFEQLEERIDSAPFFSGETFRVIDAAYAPIFRYFDLFERFTSLAMFDQLPGVTNWRTNLSQRPSVQKAVAPNYHDRLLAFLQQRGSYLSTLIPQPD